MNPDRPRRGSPSETSSTHGRRATAVGTAKERLIIDSFEKALPGLLRKLPPGRMRRYFPYLLVRSFVGDRGQRPFSQEGFWHSPDIWLYPGSPDATPGVPPQQLSVAEMREVPNPITIYAHVWNLGLAPVLAAQVEFWTQPLRFDHSAPPPTLLGLTVTDLGGRTSPATCHKLVKCPTLWDRNAIIVRIGCMGDPPYSPESWDAAADRHVCRLDNVVPI